MTSRQTRALEHQTAPLRSVSFLEPLSTFDSYQVSGPDLTTAQYLLENSGALSEDLLRSYTIADMMNALALSHKIGSLSSGWSLFTLCRRTHVASDVEHTALLECHGARLAFSLGKGIDALQLITKAVEKLRNSGQRALFADALLILGEVQLAYGSADAAVSAISGALYICEWELKDIPRTLQISNALALIHKRRGKWTVAEDVLERSIVLAEEHEALAQKWRAQQNLAMLQLRLGKVDQARSILDNLLRQGDLPHPIPANTRLTLSIHDRMCGDLTESRRNIDIVLKWSRVNGYARTEILCYEYLGDIRQEEGRSEAALRCFDRAHELARTRFPDADMICEVERRRVESLISIGKHSEARIAATEALRVSAKISEPFEIALAHRAMGLVYEAEGAMDSALSEHRLCVSELCSLGEKYERAQTLVHIARVLRNHKGDLPSNPIFEEACQLFAEMGLDYRLSAIRMPLVQDPDARNITRSQVKRQSALVDPGHYGIITHDSRLISMFQDLAKVAPGTLPVLLEGESGTGKELFAQALHQIGPRRDRNFVALNCGAIPKGMQESELFGHQRGAFTGASNDSPGLFETANGGTLFLDEIGEMSKSAQVAILRALAGQEIRRIGERHDRKVDVRFVAATNVDIEKAVSKGTFREDLFYRLEGLRLRIPPLRERRDDILMLANHFIEQSCTRHQKEVRFGSSVRNLFVAYNWPGNIREMIHKIEKAVILADSGSELTPELFSFSADAFQGMTGRTLNEDLAEVERQRILSALEQTGWVKAEAARLLKLTRTTLTSRMERLGIPLTPPRKR